GGRYSRHHQMAQRRPKMPERKNTQRQLVNESTPAMKGGAMTAPRAVPAFMMPIASERSRTGNHSETTFVAAGKPPPSPMPRRKRLAINMPNPVARPWLAQARDHQSMMNKKPVRVPSTSRSLPPPAYMPA